MPELLDFSVLQPKKEGQVTTPEEAEVFSFIKSAFFEYEEKRNGDQLFIKGRVFKQQTVAEVGTLIFKEFDSNENVERVDTSGSKITVRFIEPVNGVKQVEYNILESE